MKSSLKHIRCGIITILVLGASYGRCGDPIGFDSAETALKNNLNEKGVELGFDAKRKAIVVVGRCACSVTNILGEIDEARRFEITEGAFLDALAKIAVISRQAAGKNGAVKIQDDDAFLSSKEDLKLKGVRIFMQTESLAASGKGDGGVYEVALAVAWSANLAQAAEAVMVGRMDEIPRGFPADCSLEDWMQRDQNLISMLGVRLLFDAPKHFWVLGIAAQGDESSEDDSSMAHSRAAYMAECALGGVLKCERGVFQKPAEDMLAGDSSARGKEKGTGGLEIAHHRLIKQVPFGDAKQIKESIELKPFLHVSPFASGVRCFEQRVRNPMTGRGAKIAIVAIPSENIGKFVKR